MVIDQSKVDVLEDRFVDFSGRIIRLARKLPRDVAGKHVANQILRSGTSPAPNYGEARSAESDADFVHKLSIVLKELNETRIWLKVIVRGGLFSSTSVSRLQEENEELARIISSSIRTVKTRTRRNK